MTLDNVMQYISQALIFLLVAVIALGLIRKFFSDYLGKVKTAEAKVLDKYAANHQMVSNVAPAHIKTNYVVVFDVQGKTMRFLTSVWVYESVSKNEKGILSYKGNRFIDFKF